MSYLLDESGIAEHFDSQKSADEFKSLLQDKNVLFVSTKNADYIRNTQEIRLIKSYAKRCATIVFADKTYLMRLIKTYWNLLKFLLFDKTVDIVFIGFPPQLVCPLLRVLGRKRILIVDFFISIYDTFVWDRRNVQDKTILANIMHWIDVRTIKCADYVITDTIQHAQYFQSEFDAPLAETIVLYIRADNSVYRPLVREKPDALKRKFIVMYYGAVLPLHGVDIILESMKMLEKYSDIQCFIIGSKLSNSLMDLYKSTKNVILIDWMPHTQLVDYIAYSDVDLVGHFSKISSKAHRTIPGKAFVAQAMGKTAILGDSPANHELFTEGANCYFVQQGSPLALKNCIEQIYLKSRGDYLK